MDMQLMQMDILLHVCIIFRKSNTLSYFRIQKIKLSFIHICILILQIFSFLLICEIFNIIDHTRILNLIIWICKLHIHLYYFSNIYFSQCGVTMPLLKLDIYWLRSHWFCWLYRSLFLLTSRPSKIEMSLSNDTVRRSSTLSGPSENVTLATEFYI